VVGVTTLIVRGDRLRDTDDLAALGVPVALRYSEAKRVIIVDEHGTARQIKGIPIEDEDLNQIDFLDAGQDDVARLIACFERIFKAYEEQFPDTAHLAHSTVGVWLFYYHARGKLVLEAITAGDWDTVIESADNFIASRFGREPEGGRG
jgi:hypothetical protein